MKYDLRREIKALRHQMADLETKCQKREDELVRILEILEPFINALSPRIQKQIIDTLDDT